MTATFILTIPGPPFGKGRPRFARIGGFVKTYTPTETRNREAFIRMLALEAMRGDAPMDGPLRLEMEAIFEPPASWSGKKKARALSCEIRPTGRPDMDNLLKVMDALNGVVFKDDGQIVEILAVKRYGRTAETMIRVAHIPFSSIF